MKAKPELVTRNMTGAEMLASGIPAEKVVAILDKREATPATPKASAKPIPTRTVVKATAKGAIQVVNDKGKKVWQCPAGCEHTYGKLTSLLVFHTGLDLPLDAYKAAKSYPSQPELVKLASTAKLLDKVPGQACEAYSHPDAIAKPQEVVTA